jgi:hypothetical protein
LDYGQSIVFTQTLIPAVPILNNTLLSLLCSMRLFARATVLLTALTTLVETVEAISQVTRQGRYLYTADGNRFYIKGVAYQEQGETVMFSAIVPQENNQASTQELWFRVLVILSASRQVLPTRLLFPMPVLVTYRFCKAWVLTPFVYIV